MNDDSAQRISRMDIVIRGKIELHFHDNDSTADSDDLEIYDDWAEPEKPSTDA